MGKTEFGMIKIKKFRFPQTDLLRVPHSRENVLTVAHPAFGPDYFKSNIQKMQKVYSHPITRKRISFKEPTTSKSISAIAYNFGNLERPRIFNFQLGYILRASEGVFANPPRDAQGRIITDEQILKNYLNKAEKIHGIWLSNNDFGFAPYGTFKQEIQNSNNFAKSGLARVLEHTTEKHAPKLGEISKFYNDGVKIWSFYNQFKKPQLTVATLFFPMGPAKELYLIGYDLFIGGDKRGHAFGVLKE